MPPNSAMAVRRASATGIPAATFSSTTVRAYAFSSSSNWLSISRRWKRLRRADLQRTQSLIVFSLRDAGGKDHVERILRASPSGSFTIRHSLSQIIVLLLSGSVGCQVRPGRLGFPVAAKAAHEEAIFFASAC